MTLAGHAAWVDVETGFFPNHHDSLMRNLGALVSPALDDAIFEEGAPKMNDAGTVLGAPRPVLDRAIEAGLFRAGDAGESERVGKEFEAEVLKQYR